MSKKVKKISQHNLTVMECLNYDFKKYVALSRLIYENIDNPNLEDFHNELLSLSYDNICMLEQCISNYFIFCDCLRKEEDMNY